MDIVQDGSCCLCIFCMSDGAHGWTCTVESYFHTESYDESPPLLCCLTGKATRYLVITERVWAQAELLLNMGLCQRPQIFLCVGQDSGRQSPSNRDVWSRKHLGKSPTRQRHCLVRSDPTPPSCGTFSPINSSLQMDNPQPPCSHGQTPPNYHK